MREKYPTDGGERALPLKNERELIVAQSSGTLFKLTSDIADSFWQTRPPFKLGVDR
jgi:hypothetical protein